MKQTLLLTIALIASALAGAQSLTPTVIATTGFGYSSPELQVDMTVGETFITTLQTPDVILTQGFHQPAEQQQGGACVDSSLINPDTVCGDVYDPVCGCDGVTYSNDCQAQFVGGVTSWSPGECGSGAQPGCISPDACNFNPAATIDDGTCLFIGLPCDDGDPLTVDFVTADCMCQGEISGCMDNAACNYNPQATLESLCDYPGTPCNDFNDLTVSDILQPDCSCNGLLLGCTDATACNYNVNAAVSDNSCTYAGDPCDDGDFGTSGDSLTADCVCAGLPNGLIPGCTAIEACNYDAMATIDDASCVLPGSPCDDGNSQTDFDILTIDCVCIGQAAGCMDINACNYDAFAVIDNGSCLTPGDPCDDGYLETINDVVGADCICSGEVVLTGGCTLPDACNYDMNATVDDGSCAFPGDACDDGLAETSNDVYGFDCLCAGEIVSSFGCTMPNACNYDMTATIDDGSCYFIGDPCDDGLAETSGDMYDADCMCVGQVVMTMGCTMPDACNYDPNAAADDGSCYFVGDACDDGNPASTGDVYNSSCVCEGVVSVEEVATEISLYPNPASSEVFITIGGVAPADVTVFDATGRFVMNVQRTSHIDIQSLASGVYTFRVLHDGALWQKQVIKL